MTYTIFNYKTKKLLKAAVAAKEVVRAYQPGLGPDLSNYTGSVCLEGPHYPAAHTWYTTCEMKDGVVIKVK